MKRIVQLILFFLITGSIPVAVHAADDELSMAVFPRRNVKVTYRLFRPMAMHLSKKIKREVKLVIPKDFQSFWEELKKGEYDLVHLNQYHYIEAHDKYGYEAILKNVEFGSPTIRGVIAVRADSNIKTLQDLRGRKILFGGGPRAMISYIIPTWLLRNAGLKREDYQEVFAKNPPNALISTFHHQADAAGVGNVVLRLKVVKNAINSTMMRLLAEGPELPQLVWAVKSSLPRALKTGIQKVMSSLGEHVEGQAILDNAQLTALKVASDHEYDVYRPIIKVVANKSEGEKKN